MPDEHSVPVLLYRAGRERYGLRDTTNASLKAGMTGQRGRNRVATSVLRPAITVAEGLQRLADYGPANRFEVPRRLSVPLHRTAVAGFVLATRLLWDLLRPYR